MQNVTYHNFDLLLDDTEEGYYCRVLDSPAGQADCRFTPPFSKHELDQFFQAIGEYGQSGAAQPDQKNGLAREFGQRFFLAVFQAELLACLHASLHRVYQERANLRIRLDLTRAPELATWPWEYLYDPIRGEFLHLSMHASVARYMGLMHHILPLRTDFPLRALVVIANPSSYPSISVEREWLNLLDTVDYLALESKLILERLQKPTLLDLQRRLRQGQYHILHFIGHGVYDRQTQDGLLAFEDEVGRSRLVSGQHLGALIRDHYPLRLVLLNASRRTYGSSSNALTSAAHSLVLRGVPAVAATQFEIPEMAALAFAHDFYAHIVNMQPVDVAMAGARRAIQAEEQGAAWGAPVLLMRTPDGYLFDDGTIPPPLLSASVQESVEWRLNSLRIRTASREAMARWSEGL